MRDHSHHIELSRDDAVAAMMAALPADFGGNLQQVSLQCAFERILAADVRATADIPDVLTCAMDSIAVHWDDFEGRGEGEMPPMDEWVRGRDWEFANTGVAMPEGFDTAVVVEHATVSDDEQHVRIHAAPSCRFAGTKAPGSQVRRGDVVVDSGTFITPDVAARIASVGQSAVSVKTKPRVAFIPTGNELVPANLPFSEAAPEKFAGRGKVYESNSLVVQGKVEAWGGVFVPFDIVPDEQEAIRAAVDQARRVADIVVLNAGSSKGSDDWSVEVLEGMGRVICHQTNHGPGHHSSYALVEGTPVVGISGPSGGASFTLDFYLLPLMKRFLGIDPAPARIPVRLVADFPPSKMGKQAVRPGALAGEERPPEAAEPGDVFYSIRFLTLAVRDDGALAAVPVPGHAGSPATQHANAYCMVPAGFGAEVPRAGDVIQAELRSQGL